MNAAFIVCRFQQKTTENSEHILAVALEKNLKMGVVSQETKSFLARVTTSGQ